VPWISLLRFWSTDGGSRWDALCNKKPRLRVGCRWRANDRQAGSTASGLVPINASAVSDAPHGKKAGRFGDVVRGRVRYSCLKEAARGEAIMQIEWCWGDEKGFGKRERS
jgi:hypothetical protein